jgi:hypothetical protein
MEFFLPLFNEQKRGKYKSNHDEDHGWSIFLFIKISDGINKRVKLKLFKRLTVLGVKHSGIDKDVQKLLTLIKNSCMIMYVEEVHSDWIT